MKHLGPKARFPKTFKFESKGLPGGASGKESTYQSRRRKGRRFDPRVGKIPWRRKRQPVLIFLPGKFHGQRSLEGYSPWVGL